MQGRRPRGRPFEKGHKPAYTRKKGTKNKRTIVREYIGLGKDEFLDLMAKGSPEIGLAPRHVRLAHLLNGPQNVAGPLERDLMMHSFGRPKETVSIDGKLDVTGAIAEGFLAARRDRGGDE